MSYVLGSWAKASHSHLQAAHFLSKQGPAPNYQVYRRLFADIQDRILDAATLIVACDDEDPDTLLGYCIYEDGKEDTPPVLHYLQTKRDLMRKGIASALLDHAGIDRAGPCIYTFTSPIQGKTPTPEHWMHVPHWLIREAT